MATQLRFQFSHAFSGIIWNTIADEQKQRLFFEVRDPQKKTVSFSALNLQNNQWLWKDLAFEEPWWISMRAVAQDVLLLTIYADASNPDKKSVIAFDVAGERLAWWKNGFAVTNVSGKYVTGMDAQFPEKQAVLDLFTGKAVDRVDFDLEDSQNFPVIRPFQYKEGTAHFDTVRDFLNARWEIQPVIAIEYLEIESLIIMSVFLKETGLANYLYVLDAEGELLHKEKLGEDLAGVGLDTFYIFSGQLIFIKNKNELISFKII